MAIFYRSSYPDATPPKGRYEIQQLLEAVDRGFASVRYAARILGWDYEQVQIQMWGEVRQ